MLVDYLKSSKERGCKAYIAIAGMAAHLAGAVAAHSSSPVLGVPTAHSLNGLDAILSTLQMPAGVPVATLQLVQLEQPMLVFLQHKCWV